MKEIRFSRGRDTRPALRLNHLTGVGGTRCWQFVRKMIGSQKSKGGYLEYAFGTHEGRFKHWKYAEIGIKVDVRELAVAGCAEWLVGEVGACIGRRCGRIRFDDDGSDAGTGVAGGRRQSSRKI